MNTQLKDMTAEEIISKVESGEIDCRGYSSITEYVKGMEK